MIHNDVPKDARLKRDFDEGTRRLPAAQALLHWGENFGKSI